MNATRIVCSALMLGLLAAAWATQAPRALPGPLQRIFDVEKAGDLIAAEKGYKELGRTPPPSWGAAFASYRLARLRALRSASESRETLDILVRAYGVFQSSKDEFGTALCRYMFSENLGSFPMEDVTKVLQDLNDKSPRRQFLMDCVEMKTPGPGTPWPDAFLIGDDERKHAASINDIMRGAGSLQTAEAIAKQSLRRISDANLTVSWLEFDKLEAYGTPQWSSETLRFDTAGTREPFKFRKQSKSGSIAFVRCGLGKFGLVAFIYLPGKTLAFASGPPSASETAALMRRQITSSSQAGNWEFIHCEPLWTRFFKHVFQAVEEAGANVVYWQNSKEIGSFRPLSLWTGSAFAATVLRAKAFLFGPPFDMEGSGDTLPKSCVSISYALQYQGLNSLTGVRRERESLARALRSRGYGVTEYLDTGCRLSAIKAPSSKPARLAYLGAHMLYERPATNTLSEVSVLTSDGFQPIERILSRLSMFDASTVTAPPIVILSGCGSFRSRGGKRAPGIDTEELGSLAVLIGMGVETLLGAAWDLDDKATEALMSSSVMKYARGGGTLAASLLSSQRDYLKNLTVALQKTRPRSSGTAAPGRANSEPPKGFAPGTHPYFWAGLGVRGVDQ